jgi:hypothetical protein
MGKDASTSSGGARAGRPDGFFAIPKELPLITPMRLSRRDGGENRSRLPVAPAKS